MNKHDGSGLIHYLTLILLVVAGAWITRRSDGQAERIAHADGKQAPRKCLAPFPEYMLKDGKTLKASQVLDGCVFTPAVNNPAQNLHPFCRGYATLVYCLDHPWTIDPEGKERTVTMADGKMITTKEAIEIPAGMEVVIPLQSQTQDKARPLTER